MRELPICSVDPPGCKDIDDALHLRELPSGNMELGVHIADVTHFLQPDTAMDQEASERCSLRILLVHNLSRGAYCEAGPGTHSVKPGTAMVWTASEKCLCLDCFVTCGALVAIALVQI